MYTTQPLVTNDYIRGLKKSLKKFLSNSPLFIQPIWFNKVVRLQSKTDNERFWDFELDEKIPIKNFIATIKNTLRSQYPTIQEEIFTERNLSVEEIAQRLENGVDFNKVKATEKQHVSTINYVIDKIILHENVAIIVDTSNNKHYKYKSNLPIVFFQEDLLKNKFTKEELSKKFFKEFKLISRIDGEGENENGNN